MYVKGKIKKKCLTCKKTFLVYHCHVIRKKFCSKSCLGFENVKRLHTSEISEKISIAKTKPKIHKICRICRKRFDVIPSWRRVNHCSKKCADQSPLKKIGYWRGRNNPHHTGKNSHLWKGGITPINTKIRHSIEYKLWREAVFKRDNWKCVLCGMTGKVQADHIKPFAYYPKLRFDITNGRTLCIKCHQLTDTWGGKGRKTHDKFYTISK